MGKWGPIIFLGLAVIVGLIISVLTYNWLQQKTVEKREVSLQTQMAVVADKDLSLGIVLTKDMIKAVPLIATSLPQGYFSEPSALDGRILISSVKANELILESKLAPIDVKIGGVAAVISPNKRAMAVKVDYVTGVAGFIYPGNRVDVLVALQTVQNSIPIAKTVLQNVLVLAVGSEVEVREKREKPMQVDTVTLEVTPEEAEKLALAGTQGRLHLALRNYLDSKDVFTKGATESTLLASYSSSIIEQEMVSGEGTQKTFGDQQVSTVELIKGIEMQRISF